MNHPQVIVPDNEISTFVVKIRSLNSPNIDRIKRKLQELHEVVEIEKTESAVIVKEVR